ncbi:MAG: DUF3604 domain-containing protein, partial [Candidatus Heimdallarchaeota archaeon]|nr:DUF3604 domain-containing protein [Candidatus Heimdallarchaeota archaeon]
MGYSPKFVKTNYGTVELITPKNIPVGSFNPVELKIHIGKYGIDDGGHIKIAWPVSNPFGKPQFIKPDGENYTTVEISKKVNFNLQYDYAGYTRPFMPAITLTIYDGYLSEGDWIVFRIGDASKGSSGWRIQTYVEYDVLLKVVLDPFGTNLYQQLIDSPKLNIIPGSPSKISMITKSVVKVNENFWGIIRIEDKWGNISPGYSGEFILQINDNQISRFSVSLDNNGILRNEKLKIKEEGEFQLKVITNSIGEAYSNPIKVIKETEEKLLFWGDLHGQTNETVGSGTMEEYFLYGRDVAVLDFISHAANAFQVTKEIWNKLTQMIKDFHQPGKFITFLGYEWSGNPGAGGDHNVYYLNDDMPIHRCSHALIPDKTDLDSDRYPVSKLYDEFEGRDDVIIIPHIGGRRASLDVIDEKLTPFIEVASVHGHFEWFIEEAIERNLHVGFIASSDTHSCKPGNSYPVSKIEAVKSGITAVYANSLSREDLWKAFKAKNVYGTTGPRIIIHFSCENAIMGDYIQTSNKPKFNIEVNGSTGIEKVEVYRGNKIIYTKMGYDDKFNTKKIGIRWTGARIKNRRRNTDWSGSIEVEGGKIVEHQEYAFDLPWEGIYHHSETKLEFNSTTAGDFDGIIMTIDGNEQTIIKFNSLLINQEIRLNELTSVKSF